VHLIFKTIRQVQVPTHDQDYNIIGKGTGSTVSMSDSFVDSCVECSGNSVNPVCDVVEGSDYVDSRESFVRRNIAVSGEHYDGVQLGDSAVPQLTASGNHPGGHCNASMTSGNVPVWTRPPTASVTRCIHVWEKELADSSDKSFILEGLKDGFKIVDSETVPLSCERENYKSTAGDNYVKVEEVIMKEMSANLYVKAESKPQIVSSLGAIPKPNGNIRHRL
jgi:hypothetical protein